MTETNIYDPGHKHSWEPLKNTQSGLTNIERCAECDARHVKGAPVYVNAEGALVRYRDPSRSNPPPTQPPPEDFDPDNVGDI